MRFLIALLITLLSQRAFCQELKKEELAKIDSAKILIHKIGSPFSDVLDKHVEEITTWGGSYSTCYGGVGKKGTIYLTESEIHFGSVNNLAAAIVHESFHLRFQYLGEYPDTEELLCYEYELSFLIRVPGVENWLISHCLKMIALYKG